VTKRTDLVHSREYCLTHIVFCLLCMAITTTTSFIFMSYSCYVYRVRIHVWSCRREHTLCDQFYYAIVAYVYSVWTFVIHDLVAPLIIHVDRTSGKVLSALVG